MVKEHGTRSRYNTGCRCELCRKANREYIRDWSARRGKKDKKGGQ